MKHQKNSITSFLIIILILVMLIPTSVFALDGATSEVFINEIHYDNTGSDTGEGIEIAGPAGTNLNGWSIVLYNGNGGASYGSISLDGTVIDDEGSGYGAVNFVRSGIQNGAPDGIALVDDSGTVIQFLSYEGTLTATAGPANGIQSTDIGVAEGGTTAVGESLQLTGTGTSAGDFSWQSPATASPGFLNTNQLFGNAPSASIEGRVWHDTNNDGLRNVGEADIAGIEMRLLIGNSIQQSVNTDANGAYSFSGLSVTPTEYKVEVITSSSQYFVSKIRDVNSNANDENDNDFNDGTNRSESIELTADQVLANVDAGLLKAEAQLSGKVYHDYVSNGNYDAEDLLLEGVEINLISSSSDTIIVDNIFTDSNGEYLITGILPGRYRVRIILPIGYEVSLYDDLYPTPRENRFRIATRATGYVNPAEDQITESIDAALAIPQNIAVRGRVWNDTSGDGMYDIGEPLMQGVSVHLVHGNNNTPHLLTAITDVNGEYELTNFLPTQYRILLEMPTGYRISLHDDSDNPSSDNKFRYETNATTFIYPSEHQSSENISGALNDPDSVVLAGRVWYDQTTNGLQDGAEIGVSGVEVFLRRGTSNIDSVISGLNGEFEFSGIMPDEYSIYVDETDLPGSYIFSTFVNVNANGNDATDNDMNPDGNTGSYYPTEQQQITDVGIGLAEAKGVISGVVWQDNNGNGLQDDTEPKIDGVAVELWLGTTRIETKQTASGGLYSFDQLVPRSDYTVIFKPGSTEVDATIQDSNANQSDDIDSDINSSFRVENVSATETPHNNHVDAGFASENTEIENPLTGDKSIIWWNIIPAFAVLFASIFIVIVIKSKRRAREASINT